MTLNGLNNIRIVLAGHGSRDRDGVAEFESFVKLFKDTCSDSAVHHGYLEFNRPSIAEAVEQAAAQGEGPIVVVPALLAAATHAKNDMPSLLNELKLQCPARDIRFAAVIDVHPTLLKLCEQRIVEAEAANDASIKRADTCLVVVGRGTSDPDANGDIAKLTRMLHEGMAFGASLVCYSGTARPVVDEGLRQAAKLGYRRIIVLPYFLFDGVLVKRVYTAADSLQKRMPETSVLKAQYLGVTKEVAEVLAQRTHEALFGEPKMNCGLCKYRAPIVGYEKEVGLPQAPHRRLSFLKAGGSMCNESTAAESPPYKPHPIEAQSFAIIRSSFDWSALPEEQHSVLMRLVHTTGDFACLKDIFFSAGAVDIGVRSLLRCRRIVTDVTMVQTGLKRSLLAQLGIETWCGVHDEATAVLAEAQNLTRSAAGIRRAWQLFGNDVVVAIGDAPTAVTETVRLIREHNFRPQLVVALPVGFVGTAECKEQIKSCIQVPRITNTGTRGGSPWAATVVNALLIEATNRAACPSDQQPLQEAPSCKS